MALTANRPLDSGLVLCLRMSEGVGTKTFDVSKYQNHGTITGASWVDGKYGKALSFNGIDNKVQLDSVVPLEQFSASCWFKRNGDPGGAILDTYHCLVDALNGWHENYLAINKAGTEARIRILLGEAPWTEYRAVKSYSNPNDYHFFVGTYNGSQLIMYVDGEAGSPADAPSITGSTTELLLGLFLNTNYYVANGIIDEACIYNRVLSTEEIKLLYASRGRV